MTPTQLALLLALAEYVGAQLEDRYVPTEETKTKLTNAEWCFAQALRAVREEGK